MQPLTQKRCSTRRRAPMQAAALRRQATLAVQVSLDVGTCGWRRQRPPRVVGIQHADEGEPHNNGHRQQACRNTREANGGALGKLGDSYGSCSWLPAAQADAPTAAGWSRPPSWAPRDHPAAFGYQKQDGRHANQHAAVTPAKTGTDRHSPAKSVRSEYLRSLCRCRYVVLNLAGSLRRRSRGRGQAAEGVGR